MLQFDMEKFIGFKVNTVNYREPDGGCIKCAFSYACGKDIDIPETYPVDTSYGRTNWIVKEHGQPLATLLDDAEDLLFAMVARCKSPEMPWPYASYNYAALDESALKKFVLDGMVRLGYIASKELEYSVTPPRHRNINPA